MAWSAITTTARRFGVGRGLLYARHILDVGPHVFLAADRNIKKLLPRIVDAVPIEVGSSRLEVHMLLNHSRIYEGAWALYSFAMHCGRGIGICIHDDGTLSGEDCSVLRKLFPGIRIIARHESDLEVSAGLLRLGFARSESFRRKLVLALKLFDPLFYSEAEHILVLDSDVLFFAAPMDMMEIIDGGRNGFSVDFGYDNGYCANVVRNVFPKETIIPLNSGIIAFRRHDISLKRIEEYLVCPLLWHGKTPDWFAEQALFGLEFHALKAEPLSDRYRNVGRSIPFNDVDAIHFCASYQRRKLFYSHGIRKIFKQMRCGNAL